jgi:flagellar assembly factor FliW
MMLTSLKATATPQGHVRVSLHFPRGLVGLDHWKDFTLLQEGSGPIMLLVPEDEPRRVLPVCAAGLIVHDFEFELPDSDVALLGLESPEDAVVFTILTVQEEPPLVTANLMAPLVVNRRNGLGVQAILENSGYPLRHVVYQGPSDPRPC